MGITDFSACTRPWRDPTTAGYFIAFGLDVVAIWVGHNIVALTQMAIGGPAPIGPLKKAGDATMRALKNG